MGAENALTVGVLAMDALAMATTLDSVALIVSVVALAFAAGMGVCVLVIRGRAGTSEAQVSATVDAVIAVAGERLSAHTAQGSSDLSAQRSLIDHELASMRTELSKVTGLVRDLEATRSTQHGELTGQIAAASEQTAQLADSTRQLREALSSTRSRGQWGERMADDVLRLAGFVENVNYRRQTAVADTTGRARAIPDFTFLLPRGLELHMDVKFPFDNYVRYLDADDDGERERLRNAFVRDVRGRVRELAARDYQAGENSVDCLLLFIPNEQVYAFVQEHDGPLLDEALRNQIVLCSPLTLFAVLAVIRQSVDNFALEQTSDEILGLLGQFHRQWEKYNEAVDKLGRRLAGAQKDFEDLDTTRRRQLERPLEKIEELRRQRDVPSAGTGSASQPHAMPTMPGQAD